MPSNGRTQEDGLIGDWPRAWQLPNQTTIVHSGCALTRQCWGCPPIEIITWAEPYHSFNCSRQLTDSSLNFVLQRRVLRLFQYLADSSRRFFCWPNWTMQTHREFSHSTPLVHLFGINESAHAILVWSLGRSDPIFAQRLNSPVSSSNRCFNSVFEILLSVLWLIVCHHIKS